VVIGDVIERNMDGHNRLPATATGGSLYRSHGGKTMPEGWGAAVRAEERLRVAHRDGQLPAPGFSSRLFARREFEQSAAGTVLDHPQVAVRALFDAADALAHHEALRFGGRPGLGIDDDPYDRHRR